MNLILPLKTVFLKRYRNLLLLLVLLLLLLLCNDTGGRAV